MNRWLWIALLAGIALSAAVSYRMAHLTFLFGSEEGRWLYRYIYGFNPRSLVFCAAAFVVCGAPLVLPAAVVRRREWWLLLYFVMVGTAVQFKLRTLTPYTIGRMFESDGSNGYYGETRRYPASVLLRDFDRLRPELTIHPRSNMPGKLVLVYALERLSLDPATLAQLVIVLSNLGGVLLYLFVRDLSGDVMTAMTSLALYLFVPAKLFFFPILNTVTPVVVIACLYLWLRTLQTGTKAYAIALGVALFGLAAFEPLPLVTGLVFAALGFSAIARDQVSWRDLFAHAAVAALSFVVSAILIGAALRFNLLIVFRHLMIDAVQFNGIANRPYRLWVWRNLVDFSIGAGLPQVFMFLTMAGGFIGAALRAEQWQLLWRDSMTAFALGLGAAILLTDVLGVNRGEVVRLWIFFACLIQVPAAWACSRVGSRAAALLALAASLLIGTLGTSMIAFGQP